MPPASKPTRRCIQFGMGTMFHAITMVAILFFWLGRPWALVHERKLALEQLRSNERVTIWPEALSQHKPARVPRLREWLGDAAVAQIWLPEASTADDLAGTQRLFPEAEVVALEVAAAVGDELIGYRQ